MQEVPCCEIEDAGQCYRRYLPLRFLFCRTEKEHVVTAWKGKSERSIGADRYISPDASRSCSALFFPVDRILHDPAPLVLEEDVHARAMDHAEEVRDRHRDVCLGEGRVRRGDSFLLLLAGCRVS